MGVQRFRRCEVSSTIIVSRFITSLPSFVNEILLAGKDDCKITRTRPYFGHNSFVCKEASLHLLGNACPHAGRQVGSHNFFCFISC